MNLRSNYTVIVFLVGLMIISCAKRKPATETFVGAIGYCGSEKLGEFDVSLNPSAKQPGLYNLKIVTLSLAVPGGAYVRMALANSNLEYSEKVQYARISPNRVLYDGLVSPQELDAYDLIVIAPWKGGQSTFLTSVSGEDEAICRVPSRDPNSNTVLPTGGTASGSYR